MRLAFLIVSLLATWPATAQMVRTATVGATAPSASIEQLAWLAGSWTGTAMGGSITETYSAPLGGRITGHFVLTEGEGVAFSEFVEYVPVGKSLAYRVRHFGPDMRGWEDATGKPVVFPLIAIEGERWYFDGMTLDRTGEHAMTMWVRIGENGKSVETPFVFTRRLFPAKQK